MTRPRLIIVGAVLFLMIVMLLMLFGVIPGLKTANERRAVTLEFWGIGDNGAVFDAAIAEYRALHRNVDFRYRQFDPETYESQLVNALAAGKGPDFFMFKNTWLPKHYDKLYPMPENLMNMRDFQTLYPRVAEQDFTSNNTIFALPLYIDTLALMYNKDIFDRKGIALPPNSWTDVQNNTKLIREMHVSGNITLAGAALGGSKRSVYHASDIVSLLMLQTGVQMTDSDFSRATFARDGITGLTFYTRFADASDRLYTWNDNHQSSRDAFANGDVGMIFDYADALQTLKAKNPFLRLGIAHMPQSDGATQRVDYPRYMGLAVAATSHERGVAWDFINFFTTQPAVVSLYLNAARRPPALRVLIPAYKNDPELGVFVEQVLTARSWPQGDDRVVEEAFSNMIADVATKRLTEIKAIQQAEDRVTEAMRR